MWKKMVVKGRIAHGTTSEIDDIRPKGLTVKNGGCSRPSKGKADYAWGC